MNVCDDGYELFRRAVMERDADAWAAIAARYRPMLIAWAKRCPASAAARERYEDLADEGFARAWKALSSERFAGFPNLAALLGYLRVCVTATAIDAVRARAAYDRIAQRAMWDGGALPEQIVLERLECDELWHLVIGLAASQRERVSLIERFVLELPPRVIQARHPTLFPDVVAVYAAIRNLRERLRRHNSLQQFYSDHLTA